MQICGSAIVSGASTDEQACSVAGSISGSSLTSSFLGKRKQPPNYQNTLPYIFQNSAPGKERKRQIIKQIHIKAFRFASQTNIPPYAIRDDSFVEFTRFCIESGPMLHGVTSDELKLGRGRYHTIQAESFSDMVESIRAVVLRSREFHTQTSGKKDLSGFIYIAHDIWDGKRKTILGLTMFLADPVYGEYIHVPIGFLVSQGKSAAQVCEQSLLLLNRYGIKVTDLLKPINDTTNAALAAGRLIMGGGVDDGATESGSCDMHRGALAINHASGFLQRSKGGAVVDSFPDSADLYRKVKLMVSYLTDLKAKDRLKRYTSVVLGPPLNTTTINLPIPNKTRVNGTFIMYEAVIRSYHALRVFNMQCGPADSVFNERFLLGSEWQQLAEFTAVYFPVKTYLTSIQSDEFAAISLSRIYLGNMLEDLFSPGYGENIFEPKFEEMLLHVVRMNSPDRWVPSTSYTSLPTQTLSYVPNISEISGERVEGQVMAATRTLVERIFKECHRYFPASDEDEHLALVLNPVTLELGVDYLHSIGFVPSDFRQQMEAKVLYRVRQYYVGTGVSPSLTGGGEDNNEDKRDVSQTAAAGKTNIGSSTQQHTIRPPNRFARRQMLKMRGKDNAGSDDDKGTSSDQLTPEMLLINQARSEYRELISRYTTKRTFPSHWKNILIEFPSPLMKIEIEKNSTGVKTGIHTQHDVTNWDYIPTDVVYTHKRLDVISFWRSQKDIFPTLYPIALNVLAKPPTNAKQERMFSMATWMDGSLRQRMSDATFEMRLLEKANRKFVAGQQEQLVKHGERAEESTRTPWETIRDIIKQQQLLSSQLLAVGNNTQIRFGEPDDDSNDDSEQLISSFVTEDSHSLGMNINPCNENNDGKTEGSAGGEDDDSITDCLEFVDEAMKNYSIESTPY